MNQPRKPRGFIGLIPARGHSKAIPDKNLQEVGGVPLLARGVRTAMSVKSIERVIVSTDLEKLAQVAREEGAEVPFLRPPELSRDDSPTWEVVRHVWDHLQNADQQGTEEVEGIVLLQPTSPYLRPESIDRAVQEFCRADALCLKAVRKAADHPNWMLRPQGSLLVPYNQDKVTRRQDLPALYYPCGAIYVYDRRLLARSELDPSEPVSWIELDWPECMDIDNPEDLLLAQAVSTLDYESEQYLDSVP
jgi:CMP-N-acetylneuraminic acid synthetase